MSRKPSEFRSCRQCGDQFEIAPFDRELLDRLAYRVGDRRFDIPPPTHCPDCRLQRRMSWRGELHLFHRKSALTGNSFISYFPPDSPGLIYSRDDFYGDEWDGRSYGRDFDFKRPFFDQFAELLQAAPLLGLTGLANENSDYINNGTYNKNCYLTAAANYNEDCYYANYVNNSKSCIDNIFLLRCELCYECVSCVDCYNLRYSDQCVRCVDSQFLFDCRRCKNCFGCVNLVDASYCFFNKQLSQDDYEKRVAELNLHRRSAVRAARDRFRQHRLRFPHRATVSEGAESCSGNYIYFSTNAEQCFDVNNVQDCRYCFWLHDSRDCMDLYCWGLPGELCYECSGVGTNAYHNLFCYQSNGSRDITYCAFTNFSSNCFGCVGIIRQEYCILNKQYGKEEYAKVAAAIASHMERTGEWGEYFPLQLSPLPYNTSVAQDYFPLEAADVRALKLRWHDEPQVESAELSDVPDSIHELSDADLKKVFRSADSGKPFRIIGRELAFLCDHVIAPPDATFFERHLRRLSRRNPRRLWTRPCMHCGSEIKTSYAEFRPETVYCESCFEAEIYGAREAR